MCSKAKKYKLADAGLQASLIIIFNERVKKNIKRKRKMCIFDLFALIYFKSKLLKNTT